MSPHLASQMTGPWDDLPTLPANTCVKTDSPLVAQCCSPTWRTLWIHNYLTLNRLFLLLLGVCIQKVTLDICATQLPSSVLGKPRGSSCQAVHMVTILSLLAIKLLHKSLQIPITRSSSYLGLIKTRLLHNLLTKMLIKHHSDWQLIPSAIHTIFNQHVMLHGVLV